MTKKLLVLTALTASLAANGGTITYNMTQEFSGAQAPGGSSPWVKLTLTDVGQPAGTVQLTIANIGLLSTENMSELDFNYDDNKDLSTLSFSLGTRIGVFDDPTISASQNAFKADGDGFFDIQAAFATGGNANKVFAGGESLNVLITDSDGVLLPTDFAFLSLDAGGHGPFAAAAHIQNTTGAGSGGSGWIAGAPGAVPTPFDTVPDTGSTLALMGLGMLGFGCWKKFVTA